MNIITYGLTGAGVFVLFIIIYSYIETHYKKKTYKMKLEERLKSEMDTEEDYRHKLSDTIPISNEKSLSHEEGSRKDEIKTAIKL